jgi:hypothetical protein
MYLSFPAADEIIGMIALLDAYGPDPLKFKNKSACRLCTVPLRFLMLILALVLWILAALLIALLTAGSDFCINPNDNLYDLTTGGVDATTRSYIRFIVRGYVHDDIMSEELCVCAYLCV